jgi:hypothetical protein
MSSSGSPQVIRASFPFNTIYPPLLLIEGKPSINTCQLRYLWWKWLTEGWVNDTPFSELKLGDWEPYNRAILKYKWAIYQGRMLEHWIERTEQELERTTDEEDREDLKSSLRGLKKQVARRRHKTKRAWRRGRKPRSARRLNKK